MRGKPVRHRTEGDATRIIPAHAGQTRIAPLIAGLYPDHPRACGANDPLNVKDAIRDGSSPRMRGKRHSGWAYYCPQRIIPAHAGQTQCRRICNRNAPDHPRACGANPTLRRAEGAHVGSSPRMRGKLLDCVQHSVHRRIIPAHAGQTDGAETFDRDCSDHPRACGANPMAAGAGFAPIGSSPRMRGKLVGVRGCVALRRIIPAHAGQTLLCFSRPISGPDHPRACGANPPTLRHP